MRYLLVISFLMVLVVPSMSQNILQQKTVWYSTRAINTDSQNDLSMESQFIINAQNTIEWKQNQGLKTYTYTIVNSQSGWADVAQNGSIQYNVRFNGINGAITIGRKDGGLFIKLEFIEEGSNTMPYEFIIDRMETL